MTIESASLTLGPGDPGSRLRAAIVRIANLVRERPSSAPAGPAIASGDIVGTIASVDAIGFDPMPVLRAVSDRGAPAVVMGQVAGILHGSIELTGDLDLLWSGDARDIVDMVAAFEALAGGLTDDDGKPVELKHAFELPKVLFRTPFAVGDCCTPRLPWKGLDVRAFIERAERAEIDGATVRYVRLDDLIEMRLAARRPKDLRRAAELRELLNRLEQP